MNVDLLCVIYGIYIWLFDIDLCTVRFEYIQYQPLIHPLEVNNNVLRYDKTFYIE